MITVSQMNFLIKIFKIIKINHYIYIYVRSYLPKRILQSIFLRIYTKTYRQIQEQICRSPFLPTWTQGHVKKLNGESIAEWTWKVIVDMWIRIYAASVDSTTHTVVLKKHIWLENENFGLLFLSIFFTCSHLMVWF